MTAISAHALELVEYADGLELQRQFQESRRAGSTGDTLLLLEHPPVITLGRGASRSNILASDRALAADGIEVHETDRGGDVTYHGPGQLVWYPILYLAPGEQDVRRYVRRLEEVAIRVLARWGLEGSRVEGRPGVWIQKSRVGGLRKVAAIGVHLSRWYTRHGVALNVDPNLEHYRHIVPCGISDAGVTSMAQELGRAVEFASVRMAVAEEFGAVFERPIAFATARREIVAVVAWMRREQPVVLLVRPSGSSETDWSLLAGSLDEGDDAVRAAERLLATVGVMVAPLRLEPALVRNLSGVPSPIPSTTRQEFFSVELPADAPFGREDVEWFSLADALRMVRGASERSALRVLERAIALRSEVDSGGGERY